MSDKEVAEKTQLAELTKHLAKLEKQLAELESKAEASKVADSDKVSEVADSEVSKVEDSEVSEVADSEVSEVADSELTETTEVEETTGDKVTTFTDKTTGKQVKIISINNANCISDNPDKDRLDNIIKDKLDNPIKDNNIITIKIPFGKRDFVTIKGCNLPTIDGLKKNAEIIINKYSDNIFKLICGKLENDKDLSLLYGDGLIFENTEDVPKHLHKPVEDKINYWLNKHGYKVELCRIEKSSSYCFIYTTKVKISLKK